MLSQSFFYGIAGVLVMTMLLPTGCDPDYQGGPATADVVGSVTMDGHPVQNAHVVFIPIKYESVSGQTQNFSYGTTDATGNFTLKMANGKAGAAKGIHRVLISKLSQADAKKNESFKAAIATLDRVSLAQPKNEEIPLFYNKQSELTFDVDTSLALVRAEFELFSIDPALEE